MALAPIRSVVLGSIAFLVFWVTATFPKFAGLPIGRTAGAIVAATLTVVFQVDSPDEAYASINLPILGLLFGTMVVSIYLQRADMFKYLASTLSYRCQGGKDLLCRLSFLVALSSALFTNDTCCVLFTEFILTLCEEKDLPPEPFLLALATNANLGSSATPIGNPQNLVIAIQSKISFGKFLIGILPAMLVGVILNLCLLLGMYWNQLSKRSVPQREDEPIDPSDVERAYACSSQGDKDIEDGRELRAMVFDDHKSFQCGESSRSPNDQANQQSAQSKPKSSLSHADSNVVAQGKPQSCSHLDDKASPEDSTSSLQAARYSSELKPEKEILSVDSPASPALGEPLPFFPSSNKTHRRRVWKICVYLVALGMLAALLAGLNLSWCTITAAIALIVLDFKDAGPSLSKVSYSLLVFFSGMFITMDGFNRTGLPAAFWSAMEPYARIDHVSGIAVFSCVIVLLSNVASNVPTVLLLGPKVAASSAALGGTSVTKAWLMLAWVSTVAGNLTLVGSAANLIVCEQARTAARVPYHLSFWRHLKFGLPSTLLTVTVGLPLIRG